MKKVIIVIIITVLIVTGCIAIERYTIIMSPNVPDELENQYVIIPTHSLFNDVIKILYNNNQIIDTVTFRKVAEMMDYKRRIMRNGRYKIEPTWSNRSLINHLKAGEQAPVNMVLTHGWFLEDVAAKAAKYIEADSASLMNLFYNEDYITELGFTEETLMSLFIPNTYEYFWNTDAKDFLKRMVKEHNRFWNSKDRFSKAKRIGLNPAEVYTLASIVEREVAKDDEKKRVAGLYLNRIKKGMRLEADPTAKFATKDFKATRILYKHIRFDSPYNTYKYKGLPPGPISMASITSIAAVLDAEDHDYIFMCVDTENPGYHVFAKTLTEHTKNARKYHRWLDSLNK